MKYNLSIVLDLNSKLKLDLVSFDDLLNLDNFVSDFNNSDEVRIKFKDEINKFLSDNKDYIDSSNRVNNGRIHITFKDRNNNIRWLKVLYNNSLFDNKTCFSKIRCEFDNDDVLKELFNRKRYLLSQNEIDLLSSYLMYPVSLKGYKKSFINSFINRIKKYDDSRCYLYLRSLCNLCNLVDCNSIYTSVGNIRDIDYDNIVFGKLVKNNVYSDCKDLYFIDLIENDNYEELYNLYSLEFINDNSDYYGKGKR